jgi:hypothetical protein
MEYVLMNDVTAEFHTVTLTQSDENNVTSYMVRIGDYNYTLEDISDPLGHVLDANNQLVYVIDWHNEILRTRDGGLELPGDEDEEDDLPELVAIEAPGMREPSWDDAPAPVPGHYGPGPEPDNLPNPVTLFQDEDVGPSLDEQLTDYNPDTDIGHAVFYGEVYEIREVSTTPFIYDLLGDLVGCITNDAPYFY